MVEALRLDGPAGFENETSVGIIEWNLEDVGSVDVPYGQGFASSNPVPGDYPFTGNGFAASRAGAVGGGIPCADRDRRRSPRGYPPLSIGSAGKQEPASDISARCMGAVMTVRRLPQCTYHGGTCYVRQELPDGRLRLVTSDSRLIPADPGWEQVDKFEWEKVVQRSEVVFDDPRPGA